MCEIIEFPAKAALERHPPSIRAHSAHEQPVLRLFFRMPDGLVHRATVHTTLDFNGPEVSDEQRQAYMESVAANIQSLGGEVLELYTLGSFFMEVGEPSAEARWLMEMEQALAQETG